MLCVSYISHSYVICIPHSCAWYILCVKVYIIVHIKYDRICKRVWFFIFSGSVWYIPVTLACMFFPRNQGGYDRYSGGNYRDNYDNWDEACTPNCRWDLYGTADQTFVHQPCHVPLVSSCLHTLHLAHLTSFLGLPYSQCLSGLVCLQGWGRGSANLSPL